MTYAKFQPRNWPGGIEAFFNFSGNTIPEDSIKLMENSYYFEMIQFPVHHNVKGILWMDAWSNDGRWEKLDILNFDEQIYGNFRFVLIFEVFGDHCDLICPQVVFLQGLYF